MTKQDLIYGIIGSAVGLFLGFWVANLNASDLANKAPTTPASTAAPGGAAAPAAEGELPPGHPPISGASPTSAPPLPASGSMGSAATGVGAAVPAGDVSELPSLDPLPAASREKRTEQEYKNIQILKGLPAERLMNIMFAFKTSLGVDCVHCHIKDQFEKDDKPAKKMARKMIGIVRDTNSRLGGAGRVSCMTCHRGQTRPSL